MSETHPTAPAGPAAAPDTTAGGLPEGVQTLRLQGRTVYLLGTAHISSRSVEDARALIEAVRPATVCVELDEARYRSLANERSFREMDVVKVVRSGQATVLLAHLLLSAFQKRIGEALGVKPGAEMLQAANSAEAVGAELVLADRPIQITLRRTWSSLRWYEKLKLSGQLMLSLLAAPSFDTEEIEALKEKDMLGQVMEAFARAFPRAKVALIDERDTWLAERIRTAPGETVVAVVGAGHVAGIAERLQAGQAADLEALGTMPRRKRLARVLPWLAPLAVFGLLAYGFSVGGAQASWEMARLWVLINGVLAAAGTALALAHPFTIVAAFVAAPLTSLNPMVAAGWVAGLCEAMIRRPKVRDFEALPGDIVTLRGFWRNRITRILLVVALANLGSTIGTLVGIPLLTRLLT